MGAKAPLCLYCEKRRAQKKWASNDGDPLFCSKTCAANWAMSHWTLMEVHWCALGSWEGDTAGDCPHCDEASHD